MAKELTPDKLRKLKAQKISDEAIAAKYKIPVRHVQMMREENNIAALMPRKKYKREDIDNRYAELYPVARQMRLDGKTYVEIEQALGVNNSTVRGWLVGESYKRKVYDIDAMCKLTYEYIVYFKSKHNGNSPTYNEIADGIGCGRSSVDKYVDILAANGKIVINKDTTYCRVDIPGSQWLPPVGVRVPTKPRTKERKYRPRRDKAARLQSVGRLCDCGQEAKWVTFIRVGSAINEGGRLERMPLCNDCAEYEREIGGNVQPIDEVQA